MSRATLAVCCISLLLVQQAIALKCRTGNQQTDDQFQKVLQVCRKRSMGANPHDNDPNSDDSDSENSSGTNEEMYDKKYFMQENNRESTTRSSNNYMYRNSGRLMRNRKNQSHNNTRTNLQDNQANDYNQMNSNNNHNKWSNNYNQSRMQYEGTDNRYNNGNNEQEQACVIQCFFNELNVVDNRGFPERHSVIQLMTYNIQDPELRDFVEESITECFQFVQSDMRKEKCDFSQNLVTCLANKGKEGCEDWSN